ncbi:50S ribosomal protein L23 [Candidatus Nomurabacteria bacterium RIFCSPLOWO2_01_FULL_33_24]|uniref:Large ribosomal subunit protein uL23 n=1 Tax=Candidatus Nomurabacteria bacterium RIFCSPLOWO2_01_FULL_33_24 TaxID=1801765 RepID=A0A1F6X209_9BACT|nr:MAG: 50S ribosomal protein L23 [Candidatus Nomurabacteria bacterium RIFCSPLOWO2_01_FULL_33_24]
MKSINKIIKRPRITEKASMLTENSVYTFDIAPKTTKIEIKDAIRKLYKVDPIKIRIASVPAKNVFIRGKKGIKKGGRKAMVYLKLGDKIEFI